MSEIKERPFPGTVVEALAVLYLQKKDFIDLTPESLANEYVLAHSKITKILKIKKESDFR